MGSDTKLKKIMNRRTLSHKNSHSFKNFTCDSLVPNLQNLNKWPQEILHSCLMLTALKFMHAWRKTTGLERCTMISHISMEIQLTVLHY